LTSADAQVMYRKLHKPFKMKDGDSDVNGILAIMR